jgi:hypothetical protein
MSGLGTWLMALVGPLARQVLVALGIGVISYVGFDAAVGQVMVQAKSAWSAQPQAVATWLSMAGANTALSIIAGAITTRLSLTVLKRIGKL